MVAIHYNGYTTHNDIIHWVDGEYASWHTARIVCAGSGSTAHLFIDGAYYGSSAYGSGTAPTSNNVIEVVSYAQGVASTFYVDKIRLSSTQEESTIVEPIRINGVDLNARLSSHTYGGTYLVSGSFNSNSGVRFVKGVSEMDSVIPYCLPKVVTGDGTASKVRIRDNSTTYALQGWPALP